MTERRSWVIQVCRTCGRLADWPFCEHRDQLPPPGVPFWSWCESVTVVEKYSRRRKASDAPRSLRSPPPSGGPAARGV